jgi:uncharacterized protein (TIGR03435 family)
MESFMRYKLFIFSSSPHLYVNRRRLLLVTVACAALSPLTVTAQVSAGTLPAQSSNKNAMGVNAPEFDVISIRPNPSVRNQGMNWRFPDGYLARDYPLWMTIAIAYLPRNWIQSDWARSRILGGPSWIWNDNYDIDAKVAQDDMAAWNRQSPQKEMLQAMLQSALADRCKLVLHRTTEEAPVYVLLVGKHGIKLKQTTPEEKIPTRAVPLLSGGMVVGYQGGGTPKISFFDTSMAELAGYLSAYTDRPVVDRTGLIGNYDFELQQKDVAPEARADPAPLGIWDYEELGFRLMATKASMDTLVIDHIERPSPN